MAKQTILLIDYEPRSIERFRQPLSEAGYTVEVATDGVTGIEAFHRLNPDMVLVEAMIPKRHGFEVCQELKRTPHGRRTPVLITTGVYKGRKYRTQALHIYGCDEYIEKPIAPEQLLAVVGKFFTASGSNQAALADSRSTPTMQAASVATSDLGSKPVSQSAPEPSPTRSLHPKPPVTNSIMKDFTEEEIMARLDAILPGGEPVGSTAFEAIVEAPIEIPAEMPVEMPVEIPVEAPVSAAMTAAPEDEPPMLQAPLEEPQDPFAKMQAELTAELGSMSGALALEPSAVFDSAPKPFGADPVEEIAVASAVPEVIPVAAPIETPDQPEAPGQLVNFDVRRSRRNKKNSKKPQAHTQTAKPPQPPSPKSNRVAPVANDSRPSEPLGAGSMTLPSGTLAEAELAGAARRRGVSVWIWAVIAVAVLAAAYFTLLRPSDSQTAVVPEPKSRESAPVAETPSPQRDAPEPRAPAASDRRALVLNAIEPLPARPTSAPDPEADTEKKVAKSTASDPVATAPSKPVKSSIASWKPSPPAAPVVAPSAPAAAEEGVSGVETVIDIPTPVAPGTLVDAAEVETTPVSLSRRLPTYSMQARQLRVQGTVVMKVLVNERGTVDEVVLVEGVAGADLNDSALKAAKSWTYRPATKAGVPVKVWKVEQVTFKI